MKLDRRSFLSFVIGGAAGTALSPLPWKITDDLSIWSQNWPWTPDPENGEVSLIPSACNLCPSGCGITVRKVGERVVKIEGMKGHPVNDGGICLLGLTGPQLLYSPNRIRGPLKKISGRWKGISWDEALSEVVEKLADLRSTDQAHTVACIAGSDQGTLSHLLSRFLTVFGSPNFIQPSSMLDSYELTFQFMHGVQALPGFDIEHSDFVLSFGAGLLEGWGGAGRMFKANSAMLHTGGKLVQIEPRLSNTAAKAEEWIPINPGTETALALGLAHVMIKESLFKHYFIDYFSFGFEDWTDNNGIGHKGFKDLVMKHYDPDRVSQLTGIDKNRIVKVAKAFGRAKRPLAICGKGQGHTAGDLKEYMAVHALNALTGNINKRGGVWAVSELDYIKWPELNMDSIALKGMKQTRIDGAGSPAYPYARSLPDRFPQVVGSGGAYDLKLLFTGQTNPVYTMPDSKAVKKAFENIPFKVSFSSYMDETAQLADLILPNHHYLERYEDMPSSAGLLRPVLNLLRPVVKPLYNTRHTGDVILQIADQLGGRIKESFPWNHYRDCLKTTLGGKWNGCMKNGVWSDSKTGRFSQQHNFNTPSGKFEFFATALQKDKKNDTEPLPHYDPLKPEGDEKTYPLILIPYESMRLANGAVSAPPFMIKTVEDTVLKGMDGFVEVNPQTARQYGLTEGCRAVITTPKGSRKIRVHLFEGIMPGLVALPKGLGHTADDPYLKGKGIHFNELIGPIQDPVSGQNRAYGIRAKLVKA